MSQENVELVRRGFDAFNRRDLDAYMALMDPDVEGIPRMVAIEGDYRGYDGIDRWWKELLDVFPDFSIEVGEVRDLGDLTLAVTRLRGPRCGKRHPDRTGDLERSPVAGREVRLVAQLRHARRSPRGRGAVGARRSRRLLS
jgi:ketosteroid isomerase-like protein